MVFIRTDANEIIATGHVMRCLTIAERIVELGEQVHFLVSEESSAKLIRKKYYSYTNLHSDFRNPNNPDEIAKIKQILVQFKADTKKVPKLLMDSYFIFSAYIHHFQSIAKTIYIDDLFEDTYRVDLLINYNLYHELFDYKKRYANFNTKLLLGGKYVPLRKEFFEAVDSSNFRENIGELQVMIICGGGDKFNIMGSLLVHIQQKIREEHMQYRYVFHVIAGAYNPNIEFLKKLEKTSSDMKVYKNVQNIAEIMAKCDIAISAASTVLYECCVMKLPTIFYCVADNQKYDKEFFSRDGIMLYAGDIRKKKDEVINMIFEQLQWLSHNGDIRKNMQEKMGHLIDGRGAMRIAENIIEI